DPLYGAMVLLHDIIEILGLADFDRGAVFLVGGLDRRFVGGAAVDGDLLVHATMTADRFGQKLLGGLLVALLGKEKLNRLAVLVDGTIQISPLAFHSNIRLVHAPTDPHGTRAPMQGFLQQRT